MRTLLSRFDDQISGIAVHSLERALHRIDSLHGRTRWYLGAIAMRREIRESVAFINPGSARFASISRKLGADQQHE